MKKFDLPISISEIKNIVREGEFFSEKEINLTNAAELNEANENSLCFFENPKYLDDFINSKAGLILISPKIDKNLYQNKNNIFIVKEPYLQFMKIIIYWLEKSKEQTISHIDESAKISPTAKIGKNVTIKSNVIIEDNVEIGNDTIIDYNTVIYKNSKIGNNCKIYANVTIYEDTQIFDNVIIHSGCVIGADGFGYYPLNGKQIKIPQIGNVIIESDVELGANTTVDRATLSSTIISKGTKIDNLVQVGHNCIVGEDSVLCAQTGLAGHSKLGKRVVLAGQVGVAGHLDIGDDVVVGAKSGISKSLPSAKRYFGIPAIDANLKKKIIVSEKYLPEVVKFYKKYKKDNKG